MTTEPRQTGWAIRPSLWFDAVCLIPRPAQLTVLRREPAAFCLGC